MSSEASMDEGKSGRWALVGMLGVLAVAAAVRLPAFTFPMGPEAAKVAYVGRRWLSGEVPYRDVWDCQAPGLYLLGGAAWLGLEPSVPAFRLAMVAFDFATILLLYVLARRWCKRTEAVVAAGICGLFGGAAMVQSDSFGPGPPTVFLVTLSMLGALRWEGQRWRWLAVSGLASGAAVCVSPLAALYVLALALWVMGAGRGPRLVRLALRPGALLACALVPVGAFVAYFWLQDVPRNTGALRAFWDSAVVYNAMFRWVPDLAGRWRDDVATVRALAPEQGALWLFAAGWLLHAFSQGFRRETGLVALWALVALAVAAAGRQMYPMDFLQTIPPLAIAAALAVTNPSEPFLQRDRRGRLETRSYLLALFAVALAVGFLYAERRTYLTSLPRGKLTTDQAAVEVADLIRRNTTPRDTIYVWGNIPQIYVLADRPAADRIFYNRPLNVMDVVMRYFGRDVVDRIFEKLAEDQPCFFVTTEKSVEEEGHIERFVKDRYVLWGNPIEARPRWLMVFVRKDRAPEE